MLLALPSRFAALVSTPALCGSVRPVTLLTPLPEMPVSAAVLTVSARQGPPLPVLLTAPVSVVETISAGAASFPPLPARPVFIAKAISAGSALPSLTAPVSVVETISAGSALPSLTATVSIAEAISAGLALFIPTTATVSIAEAISAGSASFLPTTAPVSIEETISARPVLIFPRFPSSLLFFSFCNLLLFLIFL